MSPERSGSPLPPQAVTPRVAKMEVDSGNVQEAEAPRENSYQVTLESNVSATAVTNDDDLTSLSWLQDRNLLKGMNLNKSEPDEIPYTNGDSALPAKEVVEYVQPHASPTSDYVDESSTSAADSSSSSLNSPVPYSNFTPRNKHPHNVPYDPKVHTTSKPPYSFSCLIFMAIENSEQKALPVKEIYAWILEHFPYFKNAPTGWKNSVRHNLSLNKCFQKVEKAPNLGKGSLWMVDQQYRPNLLQALNRSPFHPCSTLDPNTYSTPKSSLQESKQPPRLPDPELFPFLARRLAASEIKTETSDDSLDDMDAANAMLALKHGPRILKERRRRTIKVNSPLELVQVITTSPSEDHTYSAATSQDTGSPDEAFESDDSQSPADYCLKQFPFLTADLEEQRKIAEGADALLNLAGIPTLRKRSYSGSAHEHNMKRKRVHKPVPAPEEEYERPSQFRPRLLRAKRKNDNQKRKVFNNNNNNNLKNDWVRHRKAIEESSTPR